jgi:hypothetical protein
VTDSTGITLPQLLCAELTTLLEPLTRIATTPAELNRLLRTLGAMPSDAQRAGILATITTVTGLVEQLQEIAAQPELSLESVQRLLTLGQQAFAAVRGLDAVVQSSPELTGFGRDVVDRLFGSYLASAHPLLRSIAVLATVIEEGAELEPRAPVIRNDLAVRQPFTLDRFRFEHIAQLLRDPLTLFRTEYGASIASSAEATALAEKLFPRLHSVVTRLGLHARQSEFIADEGASAPAPSLTIYVDDVLLGAPADAGVTVVLSPAEHGNLGLVVMPFGTLDLERTLGAWQFRLALEAGTNAFAYGSQGLKVLDAPAQTSVGATASATLPPTDTGPRSVLGSATGTRLEIGGIAVSAAAKFTPERHALALDASMLKSALVIAASDGDGFLAEILPAGGLRAEFDLGLGWSTDRGFALHGSASLEADLPVSASIAGLTLSGVRLALRAVDDRVGAEVSSTFSVSIGPVHARIDRVGLRGDLTFPANGGNLGAADLSLGFKAPSGVGLSIDAHGVLTGGGFLFHDPARSLYAGAMQLSLQNQLTLSAYGLITTRMPDGRPGYSMLIFITADGFKPIPLGFGFMLTSIGGMVGIHRTFDQDVLRVGLKNNILGTLLLPRDPVGNAMNLVQALSTAFPARRGSYLLGLIARITWFTPTLVTLDLALILEFGTRSRLLLLGRASALLPSRDNDLIRLNLDSIGVLDFDAGTLEADAVLVDSRLAQRFPITGSGALRARWSDAGNFVFAAGGLNPRFAPPTGFPSLERVTVALCSGRNPRLICESYFALTANTLQFGSRVSLYAEALGFSVSGDLAFDALITILPPHFIVDFRASVQLKRGSHNLFKVSLDGTLEGPLPLRLAAKVRFEILWINFTVPFRFTLAGEGAARAVVPAVRLVDEVRKALADPSNWSTRRPTTLTHGVALRSIPLGTSAGAPLALDPLGQLVVNQQVAPLNTTRDVDTYGGAPIAGDRRFNVTGRLNARAATPVNAAFAPTRYFEMSDDDKLVAPSFESMSSGLALGDDTVSYDAATIVPAPIEYEAITLNQLTQGVGVAAFAAANAVSMAAAAEPPITRYAMPLAALDPQSTTGAAALAPVRQVGRARFSNEAAAPATIAPLAWRIVDTQTGALAPLDPSIKTWSEYRTALAMLNRGGARWQMVPSHELA